MLTLHDRLGEELWRVDAPLPLVGDLNADFEVNLADFLALANSYGTAVDAVLADGDIDGDGAVDFSDFLILASRFGSSRNGPSTLLD